MKIFIDIHKWREITPGQKTVILLNIPLGIREVPTKNKTLTEPMLIVSNLRKPDLRHNINVVWTLKGWQTLWRYKGSFTCVFLSKSNLGEFVWEQTIMQERIPEKQNKLSLPWYKDITFSGARKQHRKNYCAIGWLQEYQPLPISVMLNMVPLLHTSSYTWSNSPVLIISYRRTLRRTSTWYRPKAVCALSCIHFQNLLGDCLIAF